MRVRLSVLFISAVLSALAAANENEAIRESYRLIVENSASTKKGLIPQQRHELFNAIAAHPVAALTPQNLAKYDPTGEIGFCFGRAMAVHLKARQMGLPNEAIRKLFIVGDLKQGEKTEWRFHVTTLVQGEDRHWYAIDPIMVPPLAAGKALAVTEWISLVRSVWDRKEDQSRLAKLYVVPPDVVLPEITELPASEKLESGERVIELTFNPNGKKGFHRFSIGEEIVFSLIRPTRAKHFIQALEDSEGERFDFLKLDLKVLLENGQEQPFHYDYRNYFVDLLKSFTNPSVALSESVRHRSMAEALKPGLYSLRLP